MDSTKSYNKQISWEAARIPEWMVGPQPCAAPKSGAQDSCAPSRVRDETNDTFREGPNPDLETPAPLNSGWWAFHRAGPERRRVGERLRRRPPVAVDAVLAIAGARHEPGIFRFRQTVAVARDLFELGAIHDGQQTPPCPDDLGAFQDLDRQRHAGAPYAQHDRQKLVRQRQVIAIEPVAAHEQPPRQALLDVVAPIRERRMRGLDLKGLHVAQQELVQGRTLPDGPPYIVGP